MNETKIEWTDFSANVIKYRDASGKSVWACAKVSDGCKNCYSEAIAHRYGRGGPFSLQQLRKTTPYFDDVEAAKILRSKKLSGKRVFIGDMTDCFGEWVPFEILDKLFAMFALRPDVTFQVLTKRPERMAEYLNCQTRPCGSTKCAVLNASIHELPFQSVPAGTPSLGNWTTNLITWPLPNVWLGTSVENQKLADERIAHLLGCPATVRFLSVEPMLAAIDLADGGHGHLLVDELASGKRTGIHWVIVGGESGPGARPCDVRWVRSIVEQCKAAGVPCFVKQLGKVPVEAVPGMEVTREVNQPFMGSGWAYLRFEDSKGGDIAEWPKDLQIREMPLAKVEVG